MWGVGAGGVAVSPFIPEVAPMVDNFVAEASKRGETVSLDGLSIEFVDKINANLPPDKYAMGVCSLQTKKILILKHNWIANKCFGDTHLNHLLLFHELGHCLLGRDHDDAQLGTKALSILHPSVSRVHDYEWNFNSYMDELFLRVQPTSFISEWDSYPKPPKQIPEQFQAKMGTDWKTCNKIQEFPTE